MRVCGIIQYAIVTLPSLVSALVNQLVPEEDANHTHGRVQSDEVQSNEAHSIQCQDGGFISHEEYQSKTVPSIILSTSTASSAIQVAFHDEGLTLDPGVVAPAKAIQARQTTRANPTAPASIVTALATAAIATLSPSHVITALSSKITAVSSLTASSGGPPITFLGGDILSVGSANIVLTHISSNTTTVETYAFPTPTPNGGSSTSTVPNDIIDSAVAALTPTIIDNTAVVVGSQTLTLNGPGVTMTAPESNVTEVVRLLPEGVLVAFPGGAVRTVTLSVPISWSQTGTGNATTQAVVASTTAPPTANVGQATAASSTESSTSSSSQVPMGSLIYNALNGVSAAAGKKVEPGLGGSVVGGCVFLLCISVLVL